MSRANPEVETQSRSYNNNGTTGSVVCPLADRAYTSTKTPGYPHVHVLPMHPYSLDVRRESWGELDAVRRFADGGMGSFYRGPANGLNFDHPSKLIHVPDADLFGSPAERLARARVIQDIQRVKANVVQDIVEYKQVESMFFSNARRFAAAYRAIRHGDIRGLTKRIPVRKAHAASLLRRGPHDIRRHAPEVWLEIQYGWLPFLGTTYTALTEFYARVEDGYAIRARGSSTRPRSFSGTIGTQGTIGWTTYSEGTTERSRAKYIVDYWVDDTRLANLDDWGITNPILLAWELVPYSFVCDWFLPVGSWLEQVGYQLGLTFKQGMRTVMMDRITHRNYKPTPPDPRFRDTASGQDTYRTFRWRREIISEFPVPAKPQFDPDGLRGKRILNALALLSTAFDRKPPRKLR